MNIVNINGHQYFDLTSGNLSFHQIRKALMMVGFTRNEIPTDWDEANEFIKTNLGNMIRVPLGTLVN